MALLMASIKPSLAMMLPLMPICNQVRQLRFIIVFLKRETNLVAVARSREGRNEADGDGLLERFDRFKHRNVLPLGPQAFSGVDVERASVLEVNGRVDLLLLEGRRESRLHDGKGGLGDVCFATKGGGR